MYLTVTVDTEEDNWGEYALPSYSVENVRRIGRLQEVFERYEVRPTYLITGVVATSVIGVDVLAKVRERGLCEVGTHVHPWNTPPIEEERTCRNTFISELPPSLQYRKIKAVHDAITANFGVAPTAFRSGRWGFSDSVAANLMRLRYKVDTSISPLSDWREYEGPDYSEWSHEPFVYTDDRQRTESSGALLEVPATIDFVQRRRTLAAAAYWTLRRRVPGGNKVLAALARLRLLNYVCLSPETHEAPQMIRLAETLMDRGTRVLNLFFHSPSLLENCSPFVKTAGEVTAFLDRIDRVLAFARAARLRSVTMSELTAAEVGATRVRLLPPTAEPERHDASPALANASAGS